MVKQLEVSGPNGTFTGCVEVNFNHRIEKKTHHNGITHDDYERIHTFHQVRGFVGKKEIQKSETESEDMVLSLTKEIEAKVQSYLKSLANEKKGPTLMEQLKNLGYE